MTPARPRGPCAHAVRWLLAGLCVSTICAASGCGKKGAPLPPLRLSPAAVTEIAARRTAGEIRLQFKVPSTNANGPGPVDIDRIDIYAITVAAGTAVPAVTEWLDSSHRAGTIGVKRAPDEGEEVRDKDTRPGPGDTTSFNERLHRADLPAAPSPAVPAPATSPESTPGKNPRKTPASGARAATQPPPSPFPVRVYVLRGVTRRGRSGAPSEPVSVPLVDAPPAPSALTATASESAIVLGWKPPGATGAPVSFNVYRAPTATAPLNTEPLTAPKYEQAGVAFGEEQCFVVRSVAVVGGVPVEGDASVSECITPRDVFPPAAPKNLTAIASAGVMNLAWDANTEKDLAGYLVLRAEAGGATLQALTRAPVRENTYRDTTVKPGVTYVYAVVAVDSATPPNVSAQSATRTETARF